MLRVQLNGRIHPMGEVVFHPAARRGDPEWRVMYIGFGDGGAGELRTAIRPNPQRLDTLVGKILRIIPDTTEHVDDQHAERQRPLPDSERQSVRVEAWRKEGNLGVRPAQSAPVELGRRSGRCPASSPYCRRDWAADVGNGQHHSQGRELRLLPARRQSAAAARQRDRPAAGRRQDRGSDRRTR